MRKKASLISTAASVAALLGSLCLTGPAVAAEKEGAKSVVEQGKELAFGRKKGNCLACHAIEGGELAGTIGPPLVAMKMRFPNKQDLFDQIWDARVKNPNTIMPPFGPHEILTKEEIEKVTEFIYTL